MERDAALALLDEQHDFPGPFEFRAFVRPDGRTAVVSAVRAVCVEGSEILSVDERSSRTGKWLSLRLRVHALHAEQVLDVYDVLKALDEVVMTL